MKILFLDDRQERIDVAEDRYKDDELTIVRTAEEAIAKLLFGCPWDLVCLDHDLGGESYVNSKRKDCGMEVVRWLEKFSGPKDLIAKKVIIHSSNLEAAMEMLSVLNAHGCRVIYERFRYE